MEALTTTEREAMNIIELAKEAGMTPVYGCKSRHDLASDECPCDEKSNCTQKELVGFKIPQFENLAELTKFAELLQASEPVLWWHENEHQIFTSNKCDDCKPLYTSPQPQELDKSFMAMLENTQAKLDKTRKALQLCKPIIKRYMDDLDVDNLTTQSYDRSNKVALKAIEQALKEIE